jgi:hypothetical protein
MQPCLNHRIFQNVLNFHLGYVLAQSEPILGIEIDWKNGPVSARLVNVLERTWLGKTSLEMSVGK